MLISNKIDNFKKIFIIFLCFAFLFLFFGCKDDSNKEKDNNGEDDDNIVEIPSTGNPNDYQLLENIGFANKVLISQNHYSNVSGMVSTKALFIDYKQKVLSSKIYNNNLLFIESISYSSLKKTGEQLLFDDDVYIRQANSITSELDVKWSDDCNKISYEEYRSNYAPNPYLITSYIINEETIISSNTSYNDGKYYISLVLDCVQAPMDYKKEIRQLSGSTTDVVFSKIEVEITLNDVWQVEKINIEEEYEISLLLLGTLNCVASFEEKYVFEEKEIPMEFFNQFKN